MEVLKIRIQNQGSNMTWEIGFAGLTSQTGRGLEQLIYEIIRRIKTGAEFSVQPGSGTTVFLNEEKDPLDEESPVTILVGCLIGCKTHGPKDEVRAACIQPYVDRVAEVAGSYFSLQCNIGRRNSVN